MIEITDINGNALSSLAAAFVSEEITQFQIKGTCRDGYTLKAIDVPAALTVEARFAGSGSYQNIGSSPLDLSAFDGLMRTFDIKITAAEILAASNELFSLRISPA